MRQLFQKIQRNRIIRMKLSNRQAAQIGYMRSAAHGPPQITRQRTNIGTFAASDKKPRASRILIKAPKLIEQHFAWF